MGRDLWRWYGPQSFAGEVNAALDVSWCRKGGARGYVATQTVSWNPMWKGSPHLETVLPGREFESSVPRSLQWIWFPDDPYFLMAALIHDVLLKQRARGFEVDTMAHRRTE